MAQHGTHACYAAGCRRQECLDAHNAYNGWLRRQHAYGRMTPAVLTEAAPARDWAQVLRASGMGWRRIAEVSGVPDSTVRQLLFGKQGRALSRVRAETAERLLAVRPELANLAPSMLVPAAGTQRRVQALVVTGWTLEQQARAIGCRRSRLDYLMTAESCTAETARQVRALYDAAWDKPYRPRNGYEADAQRRAVRRARERGWAPPMAWDDDEIDDPAARPRGIRRDDVA